jgi:hypothetical protein
MNAEFFFGSRTADETHPVFGTAQNLRRNQSCGRIHIRKCNQQIIELAAEGFTTLDWVRCRSWKRDSAVPTPEATTNSPEIIELEKFRDIRTWHWVCNHNIRNAPMWNGSPSPAERSTLK